MNKRGGFTLIEMMITVVIMAILLAVGAPSFTTFIQNAQIRTAAENLQAGLSLARSEALRRNAHVSLWMVNNLSASCARSATGTSWVVSQDNPAGNCAAGASDTTAPRLIQTRSGSDGSSNVTLSAVDSGGSATSCITFNGFGQVETTCNGGGNPIARVSLVSAVSNTRALDIRVTAGGATRTCNPAETGSSPTAC